MVRVWWKYSGFLRHQDLAEWWGIGENILDTSGISVLLNGEGLVKYFWIPEGSHIYSLEISEKISRPRRGRIIFQLLYAAIIVYNSVFILCSL